jgi:formate/nitrite transporter
MSFKTPHETLRALYDIGIKKSSQTFDQMILLGTLAGVFIAFGGILALNTGGNIPEIADAHPGIGKTLMGATFPAGLFMVVITGSDLFTGLTMQLTPALVSRKISFIHYMKSLVFSYITNCLGTLLIAYCLVYVTYSGTDPWVKTVKVMATKKMHNNFGYTVISGIAANFLVNIAVFGSIAANDIIGKVAAIWIPIFTFVACGFEHSIANSFFVPLGLLYGADGDVGRYIWANLVPSTLGNIIAGVVFVGLLFWYVYGLRSDHPNELSNIFSSLKTRATKKNGDEDDTTWCSIQKDGSARVEEPAISYQVQAQEESGLLSGMSGHEEA